MVFRHNLSFFVKLRTNFMGLDITRYHEISRAYISISLIENTHLHKDRKKRRNFAPVPCLYLKPGVSIIQGKLTAAHV